MRNVGFPIALFVACLSWQSVQAQPARNPIVPSITGTNAEPTIYRDVNLSTFELLTGSLQFKEDAESAKAVFAPFKLRDGYTPIVSEFAINLAQKKGVTTIGLGTAYNSKSGFSKSAVQDLQSRLNRMKPFRSQQTGESEEAYNLARNAYNEALWAAIYDAFYTALAKHAWMVSGAWNMQTFSALGGDKVDADQDGVIDNAYRRKGYDFAAAFTYTKSQATGLTMSSHAGRRRQSAKADGREADYRGWSLSFAQRVRVLDPDYKTSKDYLKSLFIPALLIGASFEQERCVGEAVACEDGLRRRSAFTPFLDIKVSPEAQFRIGVPLTKSVVIGGKSKTELAATAQYALQLKGIK